jgi:hypothetical protein
MSRIKAIKHGRTVSIVVAASAGFLLGGWSAGAIRSSQSATPAQVLEQRFPRDLAFAPAPQPIAAEYVAAVRGSAAIYPQAALFNPEPMVPQSAPPPQRPIRVATAETENPGPTPPATTAPVTARMQEPPRAKAVHAPAIRRPETAAKPVVEVNHRHVDHHGYTLDDSQIASIRRRLHLTPEQERMWPAVAVALRRIADTREHEARRNGRPGTVDPNSREVQDLKYAAIPLLMSFDDEQKDEVRNLAHTMGLDQLASQF